MIVLEFIIFVVSSGLFCSERFRNHIWAVLFAGAIATGSSLLFMWDLGVKVAGHPKEPPVITRIVKETVEKPVLPSHPAAASTGKPHGCADEYPADSLAKGEEGNTKVGFKILTDGTVDAVIVLVSSGSQRLDDAAVNCVKNWHYRPAIKDGKLAEVDSSALVKWVLPAPADTKTDTAAKPEEKKDDKKTDEPVPATDTPSDSQKGHHWYDPRGWFSPDADKKPQAQQPSQP